MKALFAQAALYSSSRILPLAVSDSPSRPWQSRWAGQIKAQTRCISPNRPYFTALKAWLSCLLILSSVIEKHCGASLPNN